MREIDYVTSMHIQGNRNAYTNMHTNNFNHAPNLINPVATYPSGLIY